MSKTIERSALVSFSAQQMFELINDIESYPNFMAGCLSAKVIEQGPNWLTAKLDLGRGSMRQSFTTRNTLTPPESMTMELVDGPFKVFKGEWSFKSIDDDTCKVKFRLEYEFSNFLLGLAGGKLMDQLAGEQVDSLCKQAKTVYCEHLG